MAAKILIVDDDQGFRFPIHNLFEDHGFEVVEADSVEKMRSIAAHADVWIVDVRLPTEKMEGIEAVRQLWRDSRQHPTVFFISVMPEWTAKQQLQALEAESISYLWLEKPFELELLLRKVKDSLSGGQ